MPSSKRCTPFQPSHELEFGLKIVERLPTTSAVASVVCRFCDVFGREENVRQKRKARTTSKYYRPPFRPEYYRTHNDTQHPKKWEEYKNASTEEQEVFFDITVPFKNTLHRHFETDGEAKKFRFDAGIVDNLIGNFFFDMDDRSDESEDSEDEELAENIENASGLPSNRLK